MIDWTLFAARVPAGTRIRSTDYDPLDDGLEINVGDEGIVTRHRREINDPAAREYGCDQLYCKFDHLEDEWPMHPTCIEYLIDGTWHSYDELMPSNSQSNGKVPTTFRLVRIELYDAEDETRDKGAALLDKWLEDTGDAP